MAHAGHRSHSMVVATAGATTISAYATPVIDNAHYSTHSASLVRHLADTPVMPLIHAIHPATAVATARALAAGGMRVVEVVQRTGTSLACLSAIANACPDLLTGAGTVMSKGQADDCIRAGARFIVSPGLDPDIVAAVHARGVDILPGVMTPTELMQARRLSLATVKFFPAAAAGGVPALSALASVFAGTRFVPTGGISAANLADYLAQPAVLACAGSWLTPADAIAAGDFDSITELAAAALAIARKTRS